MDVVYLHRRKKNIFSRFKLYRRCAEAVHLIKKYKPNDLPDILDVGACDGTTIAFIKNTLKIGRAVGLEENEHFISAKVDTNIELLKGDAEHLPFGNETYDIVLVSSVIEHIKNPNNFFNEAFRVLRKNGILIVFAVVPFYEKLSVKMKLKPEDHFRNFKISELKSILKNIGFEIIHSSKFSFPASLSLLRFELFFEKILHLLKLDFLMFYQEIIVKKL